ncbi:ribonuclease P protein subunit RPR2, putative [Plasmodium sp. gorilla clade G2]|uniref:ribonuclease P protein subunit RPR2, putative n=1 Tax=Plasmodium sp. gorilla clade G2 TaxID=880535 RepID=UPI000D207837|nr:ribonuclease P protein subunit RPR2, putative [Plasmodium sp. gorilla clade G2]SOV17820.1 ribonuclease P protein subunit RPR2, putative [Plasmodium sp. gorilla clade G2]
MSNINSETWNNTDKLKRKLSDIYDTENDKNDELKNTSKVLKNNPIEECNTGKGNNDTCNTFYEEHMNNNEAKNYVVQNFDGIEKSENKEPCMNESNQKKKRKKHNKKKNNNMEMGKPLKQMVRINYLLQASFLMNNMNPNISREYIKTMRRLSNKFLIKYDRKFKKLFCKKCNSVLIPSETCDVFVNPLNLQKKHKQINNNYDIKELIEESTNTNNMKPRDEYLVSYKCKHCQHYTKLVYE